MVSAGPLGSAQLGNWELLFWLHGALTSSRSRWRPGREGRGRAGPGGGGGASAVPSTAPQHAQTPPPDAEDAAQTSVTDIHSSFIHNIIQNTRNNPNALQ